VDWVVSKNAWVWFSWIAMLWFYFCYFWSTPHTCNSMSFELYKTHLASSSSLRIAYRHRVTFCDGASSCWSSSKQPIKSSVSPFRLRKRYRQRSHLHSYFDLNLINQNKDFLCNSISKGLLWCRCWHCWLTSVAAPWVLPGHWWNTNELLSSLLGVTPLADPDVAFSKIYSWVYYRCLLLRSKVYIWRCKIGLWGLRPNAQGFSWALCFLSGVCSDSALTPLEYLDGTYP